MTAAAVVIVALGALWLLALVGFVGLLAETQKAIEEAPPRLLPRGDK